MNYFVRPVQLDCPQCGQSGVAPRVSKIDTKKEIREEAAWTCHTCGTFFKRGLMSIEEKKQPGK